jgi:alkanesulfonate monooxygenase SsuD/methylene tetrahydromethanopterin reductase-like flavin-dependent oxidoreductase (luciferase family)
MAGDAVAAKKQPATSIRHTSIASVGTVGLDKSAAIEGREAMHVGFAPTFMNTLGTMSDLECFKHELALCDLAEPLGFDSIWQPEHHFSGYEMTPNVLQFLTYMAGRTKTVRLGSMVVVLPWHNPLRVVEDVTLLDHYSGGRTILGIGRGLGAMEFGGFGIEMSDTRDLFVEKAETVVNALKTGVIEHDGKHVKQPRRSIRPAPFTLTSERCSRTSPIRACPMTWRRRI